MPGSKKDRKNGKDSGGVVAAVTKHGAKFTNGNGSKGPSPIPSPPSTTLSPEIAPTVFPPNDHPAPSPLLDAVSTASFATSNSPNTREWTRSVAAGMAGSPGNLISLVGESPPTAPSSYEDTRGLHSGWSSPRPVVNHHAMSASPPSAARRPLSFHMDNHSSPPDIHGHIAAAAASRRSSMHSHFAQVRGSPNPPLPHQPQPHFYGAPDIDLDHQSGMKAGEKGHFFGFDTLPIPNADHVPGKDKVALAGYEGGLEVYSVGKRGLDHVASLKGLRGGVYHAKILPWTTDGADIFPLVAVVIHGPNIPLPTPDINVEGGYDAVSADRSESMANVNSDAGTRDSSSGRAGNQPGFAESYQTTVEIYSLKTGRLVSVLLEAPKIPLKLPITSPIFKAPPLSGAFHIHASSGNIVVSSGITGECWIYRQAHVATEHGFQFRCHGKIWTTLQQPPKGDSTQENERNGIPVPSRPRPQSAIMAVNGRWIAYCPATPSSQIALRASVPVPLYARAPGLSSMTPPQLPPATSDVDLPLSESVMNKIIRDTTQELIQGARWVGKHGLQAWNNYWNPPQPTQAARSPPMANQAWSGGGPQFPPTHGTVTPPVPKEPGIVSIVDTETLGPSANIHPIATFPIPHGCSFLSFSPTGLALFTASSKGDVQTVWDLMRIQYTKASPVQAAGLPFSGGPRVRQVAQFSRMTVARIVDIAWTKPHGERAAMVTERGTVHLLDLPASAFSWPPPRRRTHAQDSKGSVNEGPASAVSIASNALSSVRDVARPLMSRPRRSNSNAPQTAAGGIGEYAAHGGKVIAAGISHSLGKTGNAINQLRHTGENRVSLPSASTWPGPSCVTWITGRKDHFLFVLGGGLVRTFPTKSHKTRAGGDRRAPRLSRYQDFKLPSLPDNALAPYVRSILDPDEYLEFSEKDLDPGNETMVLEPFRPRAPSHIPSPESSIPQAEIESSAPYQPFHTDRRVGLYEVAGAEIEVEIQNQMPANMSDSLAMLMGNTSLNASLSGPETETAPVRKSGKKGSRVSQLTQAPAPAPTAKLPSQSHTGGAWAFGQAIKATKLDLGLPHLPEEASFNIGSDHSRALPPSAMERILERGPGNDEEEHIVITTRRRRGAAAHSTGQLDDDGFFEDDCEVLDFADQRV